MSQALTQKQEQLLTFLRESERTPSYDEMARALGLASKSGVHRLIDALEERGFIERIKGRARCIRVLDQPVPLSAPTSWVPARHCKTDDLLAEVRRRGFAVVAAQVAA